MAKTYQPLFSDSYLRAAFANEYSKFVGSVDEEMLITRLQRWEGRAKNLTETQEEGAFMDSFFKQLWGYSANGETANRTFRDIIAPFISELYRQFAR